MPTISPTPNQNRSPSRRGVIATLAAAPAGHTDDQALFSLLAQLPDVRARRAAAAEKRGAAWDAYFDARPENLVAKAADTKYFGLLCCRAGEPYDERMIEELCALVNGRVLLTRLDLSSFSGEFRARAVRILQEWEAWCVADEAAQEKCGLGAAERDDLAARAAQTDLFHRIATTPAASAQGALAKIAAVADIFEDIEQSPKDCTADHVVFSAVRDIGRIVPKTSVAQSRRRTKAKK